MALEPTTPQRPTLVNVIADFDSLISRLSKVSQHFDNIGDRLEGTRPQEAASAQVDPPPHSTIHDLQRKRDAIGVFCDQLESHASRIDNAFGLSAPSTQAAGSRIR